MADGPSAEDAAADLGDGDSRLTRDRHKRQDASSAIASSSSTGQSAARRVHEDASVIETHSHHRQQYRPPRRACHAYSHSSRRHPLSNSNNNNNNNNRNQHCHRRERSKNEGKEVDGKQCVDKKESVNGAGVSATRVFPFATLNRVSDYYADEDEYDEDADDDDDGDEEEEEEEEEEKEENEEDKSVSKCHGGVVRVDVTKTANEMENGDDSSVAVESSDGRRSTFLDASAPTEANDRDRRRRRRVDEQGQEDATASAEDGDTLQKVNRLGCDNDEIDREEEETVDGRGGGGGGGRKTDGIGSVGSSDDSGSNNSSSDGSGGAAAPAAVSASGAAAGVTANGLVAARHQGSPFKGQVRTAEDTLVGPCGKKRCADRYDSSESSDSGVAVSCGECSSSGTSDITEPGSPCSTSSDEGVAIRGASASPLPSLPKLAPSSQINTRPQWPWTPPLAATACSTYKRLKGEPEAGALPRSGAADPTFRGSTKSAIGKPHAGHHHHESQGKITEYFKTQIKPQQPKVKKNSDAMSVLVAKSSSEFRRPSTVQRSKGGLAKYLGAVSSNGRNGSANDWEARTLTMSPPPTKKPPPVIVPRANGKLDKKLPKSTPSLPVSTDVLKSIPSCKITSLRLTSETNSNAKNGSPSSSPPPSLTTEADALDFKGCILSKSHVNENNNLTNGCGPVLGSLRSQASQDPLSRLSERGETKKDAQASPADEDDVEEEEEDSRSSESKPPLSPILSAPTTIRFPAREPEKDRQQVPDSGVCRWDKCEESFESSGGLLEHLQVSHINTQTGGDNFVCQWQGCKVQGRSSCSRRWLERHVLSHGGNKPFRCIVDGCGSRFSSQTALERHVNGHFNQPETSNNNAKRSCESGGKLVRRNGKRLRYRRQPWSARLFDYFDSGVMEGLQHRLLQLAKSRTQGYLAETPGNSMALTSQVLARRVELDGKAKVLLRWYPPDIEPDEWVLESEVQSTKNVGIRKVASTNPEEVSLALYSAISGSTPPLTRVKQRRKPVKNS